jgi:hypothetical protein
MPELVRVPYRIQCNGNVARSAHTNAPGRTPTHRTMLSIGFPLTA